MAIMTGAGFATMTQLSTATDVKPFRKNRYFVLVHGAWHSNAQWNAVALHLVAAGANVVCIDLPGHGLKAQLPAGYLAQDPKWLQASPSAIRDVSLEDCVQTIADVIAEIDDNADVTLVGHSMSGVVITKAGDLLADRLSRIVYVSAYVPVKYPNSPAYIALPENASSRSDSFIGDPQQTAVVRINPRSSDLSYLERLHGTFYSDMSFEEAMPYLNGLTPDLPVRILGSDARGRPETWGRIERAFIRCTLDTALPLPLQDLMIREADERYPENPFIVHTLEAGHSPFASMPKKLADILIGG
ncbi:alpha/beta fold hydrolase [Neorhizobium sp. DT-125]|uniref:alpha/beta fold hydrolase n=1 Tax=Neorhizobium sp. DT-125 TaxID=3396163 RepID=UPI003F1C12BA